VKPAALIATFAFACAVSLAALPQEQSPTSPPAGQTPGKKGGSTTSGGGATMPGSTTQRPTSASETAAMGKTSAATNAFIMKAAEGGKAEVELGNLASSKASNADVKNFGQMMASDHGKANDELASLAKQKNVTLPSDLNAKHKATHDKLDKLSGAAFDKAYMADMVSDHQTDIKEFETAAKSSDADVKAFAEKTLPTLRHHLEEAQRISKEVAKSGASTTGAGSMPNEKPASSTTRPNDAGKGK
jgi:putative membrane protein